MATHTLDRDTSASFVNDAIRAYQKAVGKAPSEEVAALITAFTVAQLSVAIGIINIQIDAAPTLAITDNEWTLFDFS